MNSKPIWERLNVDQLLTQFVAWLPSLASAFLLLFAFWAMHKITRQPLIRVLRRAKLDPALSGMIERVFRFTIMTFGVLMAVNQLGINVGAALAGLGVVGLTIGFAAKDTLSNVISGFLIFWDEPFRAGDWVTVGGNYGKVVEITMRTTRLLTWNNTSVIIPNEAAITQVMVNHSSMGHVRVEVPIAGVPITQELRGMEAGLLKAVQNTEDVLHEPAPAVALKAISGATADLVIYAWVENAESERPVYARLLEASERVLFAPKAAS
jgi:small conductance mechanosensitive channel